MSDKLAHFGVLGMKWGIRRRQSTSSADHLRVAPLRKKKAHELSDVELATAIKRIRLEKEYSELNGRQLSAGEKFIKSILSNEAKRQASTFVSAYGSAVVKSTLEGVSNFTPPAPYSTSSKPKVDYVDSYFVK